MLAHGEAAVETTFADEALLPAIARCTTSMIEPGEYFSPNCCSNRTDCESQQRKERMAAVQAQGERDG